MKLKYLSFFLSFLIITSVYASEVTGTINTGGSNAVGSINTGGSQSTSTASTTVSGTVIVTPLANIQSGVYVRPISVNLSALNSDSIRYTLDNTVPTCSGGNTFSSAININSTTTLKAVSCYGIKASPVEVWNYIFKLPKPNQGTPVNGNLTLQGSTTQAVISNDTSTFNLTIPSGVATPTVDMSSFIKNGTGVLPEINITSSNANNSQIRIPNGATVTSSNSSWDGIISAPVPRTLTLPNPSGATRSFSQAVELGISGVKLSFTKGVRILLSGQAGKKTGWTRDDSTYTEITTICSADSQIFGDALPTEGDCKIDVGSDLVVWTKHFTTFVTYTETTVSSGGGGGGGGGGGYVYTPTTTTSTTSVQTTTSSVISTSNINASTTVVSKFIFTKNLSQGSTGNEVLELQKLLSTLGYFKSTPNGNYGPATKQAVISFQIANKISATGTIGPLSRTTLNSLNSSSINTTSTPSQTLNSASKTTFMSNLSLGSKGNEVLELQKLLVNLGLLKATPNGYFGPATRLAVITYQKQNRITQTGTVGPMTRAKLNQ